MNDMERRKFEDSFQDAFRDAESSPSENVWTNIELDLEKADGDKMKRRLVFFKTLAAASIVFAMCVAGIGYYVFQRSEVGNLAEGTIGPRVISPQDQVKDETSTTSGHNDNSLSTIDQDNAKASDDPHPGKDGLPGDDSRLAPPSKEETHLSSSNPNKGTRDASNKEAVGGTIAKGTTALIAADKNRNSKTSEVSQATAKGNDNDKALNATSSDPSTITPNDQAALISAGAVPAETSRDLPALYQPAEPELRLPVSTADPGMLLLAKLADEEKKYALEEKNQTK